MRLILSKVKVNLVLLFLYATQQSACASQLRSRDLEAFNEPCTALIVEKEPEDSRSLVCETSAGLMYEISQADDQFIVKNFEEGPFVSGETDVTFSGGARMNRSINSISNSIEDLVLTKKKNVSGNISSAGVVGQKTVLVVRVIATDDSTTDNETTLSNSVFGNGIDPVNLKSQYAACSRNQLIFNKASDRTGNTGKTISNGVTTVNVNVSTSQGDSTMNTAISNALKAEFGVSNPNQLANYVMYCLPPGTMSGIAYAYINSWNSVYSDRWCTYVSAQLHEIGHNIGLAHSNEQGEYRDTSGMMGYSYSSSDTPEMCFNAAKSWQLRWFQNRHEQLNIESVAAGTVLYDGELAYFNDGVVANPGPPMIIKLNTASSTDFYMFFNRKVDFNKGTQEGGNQVMIVSAGGEGNSYAASELLAKLSTGGTWTESSTNAVVEVISIGSRANVKICKEFCSSVPVPTKSPTNAPTPSPSQTRLYVEVESETCEAFGYQSIYTKAECTSAAAYIGRTVVWGPHGGYRDVVDGCSARSSYSSTQLFLNVKGYCDPNSNQDGWTYTGCKCADWMPCLCRASIAPTSLPTNLPTPSPTISPTNSPTNPPTPSPTNLPTPSPSNPPTPSPTVELCPVMDALFQTIYLAGAGACWRVQLAAGGTLEGDFSDPRCSKDESEWQSTKGIFSLFDSINTSTNTVEFIEGARGFSGTFRFKEDPTLTKPSLQILDWNQAESEFELQVMLPTCSPDAICPTMKIAL